jgi:acyl carrier protein
LDQGGRNFWLDREGNRITSEIFLTLCLASWESSYLIIIDLIEDKLGYEKDELKVINRLISDLDADSFDLLEIALYLDKVAGILIYEAFYFEQLIALIDYIFWIFTIKIKIIILVYSTKRIKIY